MSSSVIITRTPSAAKATIADRKSTRLNSSHDQISYAVFCLKKKKKERRQASGRKKHDLNLPGSERIQRSELARVNPRRDNRVKEGSVRDARVRLALQNSSVD